MQNFSNMTIKELDQSCNSVNETQQALEAELDNHLGYDKTIP